MNVCVAEGEDSWRLGYMKDSSLRAQESSEKQSCFSYCYLLWVYTSTTFCDELLVSTLTCLQRKDRKQQEATERDMDWCLLFTFRFVSILEVIFPTIFECWSNSTFPCQVQTTNQNLSHEWSEPQLYEMPG
jgi:hypothetical protein